MQKNRMTNFPTVYLITFYRSCFNCRSSVHVAQDCQASCFRCHGPRPSTYLHECYALPLTFSIYDRNFVRFQFEERLNECPNLIALGEQIFREFDPRADLDETVIITPNSLHRNEPGLMLRNDIGFFSCNFLINVLI